MLTASEALRAEKKHLGDVAVEQFVLLVDYDVTEKLFVLEHRVQVGGYVHQAALAAQMILPLHVNQPRHHNLSALLAKHELVAVIETYSMITTLEYLHKVLENFS